MWVFVERKGDSVPLPSWSWCAATERETREAELKGETSDREGKNCRLEESACIQGKEDVCR